MSAGGQAGLGGPPVPPPGPQGDDGQGEPVVAGERAGQGWVVAEELVPEPEETVRDQVDVEPVARQPAAARREQGPAEHDQVEDELRRRRGPPRRAVGPGDRPPGRRADAARAAPGEQAADPPQDERDGDYYREDVAGRPRVPHDALHELDREVAAEQAARDAPAGEQRERVVAMVPALGEQECQLGAEQRPHQPAEVDERQPPVVPAVGARRPAPQPRGEQDPAEGEQSVRAGLDGLHGDQPPAPAAPPSR
jgi:hypothetical protein